MKIRISIRRKLAGGSDIMDLVMAVVHIVGIAVTIVCLKRLTPLPFWACCLIGFPLFLGVLWGTLYLLSRRRG